MAKDVKQNQGLKPFKLFTQIFSQDKDQDAAAEKKSAGHDNREDLPNYKFVFFIVDWNQIKSVSAVLEATNVALHFINKGKGTASSEILDLLGIGINEKAVIICFCSSDAVFSLMKEVRRKLNFHSPGAGIAFAVPISAINFPVIKLLGKDISKHKTEENAPKPQVNKETNANSDRRSGSERRSGYDRRGTGAGSSSGSADDQDAYTHDLIIAAVNQGYSDELMIAAREAGAFGGTIVSGRSQTDRGAVKFLGISVQDEREIILILSTKEKKLPIMRAIAENRSAKSRAQGLVFSLPAENVMGLSYEL